MAIVPSTGTKLFIGTQATDAATDTYTEIANVTQLGSVGDAKELVTALTLGDGRTRKQTGTSNAGQFSPNILFDQADAGQTALIAAGNPVSSAPFNFRIEFNDTPASGPSPTPTTILAKCLVLGTPFTVDGPNDFVRLSATIEIDTIESITPAATGA